MKIKNLKRDYRIFNKEFRKIKHQIQFVNCYGNSKTRERCMVDLKDQIHGLIYSIDKYKALVIKSECKDHCYNFLNVLSKEVDYDSSIREFAEFIKGKHIVIGNRVYFSLSERVLACKTLIISYFTIRKIVGIDRKLYALQKELLELLELME